MVDASLFCAAPIPYRISTLKSRTSNLPKIEVLEFPAPPPNAQAADAPRQPLNFQISNFKFAD
jgi:hypothetical protein